MYLLFIISNTTICGFQREVEKAYSTWYSQAVSHPSTNQAGPCLASEIRRDRAYSGWYGRKRMLPPTIPYLYKWIYQGKCSIKQNEGDIFSEYRKEIILEHSIYFSHTVEFSFSVFSLMLSKLPALSSLNPNMTFWEWCANMTWTKYFFFIKSIFHVHSRTWVIMWGFHILLFFDGESFLLYLRCISSSSSATPPCSIKQKWRSLQHLVFPGSLPSKY